jgi:hypothetical protein
MIGINENDPNHPRGRRQFDSRTLHPLGYMPAIAVPSLEVIPLEPLENHHGITQDFGQNMQIIKLPFWSILVKMFQVVLRHDKLAFPSARRAQSFETSIAPGKTHLRTWNRRSRLLK